MSPTATRVRSQRRAPRAVGNSVAVTGAAGELGSRVAARLVESGKCAKVVGIDTIRGGAAGVTWRRADVRDPTLRTKFAGVDTVVHLALDRRPDAQPVERRTVNVRGTENVLAAAASAGVSRVVLLTSVLVYDADAANPDSLPDDSPVRAEADLSLIGDWVEMERLAGVARRGAQPLDVVVVRPAPVAGADTDALVTRLFEAPRLLAIRGAMTRWQFCHVDDLTEALAWAALRKVDGPLTAASPGWLSHEEVERITGMRSVVVSEAMAFATAERLYRVGVLSAPASELRYLAHSWVVGADQLRAAGWSARWDNASALAAHMEALGDRGARGFARIPGKDATRAAAGATVAVVGAVAIARARAARRRRRG
jgi:nucleoside-diphosphate-sugar epimerase